MKLKQQSYQRGWTMIELVFVMVIMGVLAAMALPSIMGKKEDANYSATIRVLQNDFPSAIMAQVARTNKCNSTNMTRENLLKRGLPEMTVWNEAWSVTASGTNVTVTYPLNAKDSSTGTDMRSVLLDNPNIVSVTAPSTGVGDLVVTYRCN